MQTNSQTIYTLHPRYKRRNAYAVLVLVSTAALLMVGVWTQEPSATTVSAKSVAVASPTAASAAVPTDIRGVWAADFAKALGNEQPSNETVAAIVAWTLAEDSCLSGCGYASAFERNNPLNTTQAGYGETDVFNSHGVRDYNTRENGIAATVQTLTYDYPGYAEIVAGIRTNDVARMFAGIHASPWCSGCYGGNIEQLYQQVRDR